MLKSSFRICLNVSVFLPREINLYPGERATNAIVVIMNLQAMEYLQSQNLCYKNDCHKLIVIKFINKNSHRCHLTIGNILVVIRSNLTLFYQSQLFQIQLHSKWTLQLFFFLPERASSDTGGKVRLCTVVCLFYLKPFQMNICF